MLAVRRALVVVILVAAGLRPLHAQSSRPVRAGAPARPAAGAAQLTVAERRALQGIAAVENARALGEDGAEPLVTALSDASPHVRRAAVRALGRLQRADLVDAIEGGVDDADVRVRVEAVNAIAQALQGLRGLEPSSEARRRALDDGVDALVGAAERRPDPRVLAIAARSLGRLPYGDSVVPRAVERVITQMGERPGPGGRPLARTDAEVAAGMMHGLYALARSSRTTGSPSLEARSAMRWATTFGLDAARPSGGAISPAATESAARVRRLAYLALTAARDTSSELTRRALRDADEQVRRLAVVAAVALEDTAVRRLAVTSALRDPSFLVRFEGVRSHRALPAPRDCTPMFRATLDPSPHVALAAIDALGGGCDDRAAAADSLLRLAATPVAAAPSRPTGGTSWHVRAHALLALARLSPPTAIPLLRRDALHPVWQVRLYVARGALVARDTLTLSSLAFDTNGNVREAALAGISATVGHAADKVYVAALSAHEYQVVLQASQALREAPAADSVVPALFAALERLTAERRENARDPRVALIERIGELGNERQAQRLAPYVADFDSTVASRAARIMERWTLRRAVAAPRRLPLASDPVEDVVGGELRLLVRMAAGSGGGVFVVRLLPDEAPLTVARVVKLAREGYYAGLSFHRVEPSFVIQGGSPAASEYVGDGPFMRDEVGIPSHLRGTLGISTRGRDTGDAQLFVNLTDNVRLDHDYTVFGEIIQGREVAERVLEGDVIERVDVVRVR